MSQPREIPILNYRNHPGFAKYTVPEIEAPESLKKVLGRVDTDMQDLISLSTAHDKKTFNNQRLICERHEKQSFPVILQELTAYRSDWTTWENNLLIDIVKRMQIEYGRLIRYHVNRVNNIDFITRVSRSPAWKDATSSLPDLHTKGSVTFRLPPEIKSTLQKNLYPYIDQLRALETDKKSAHVNPSIQLDKRFIPEYRRTLSQVNKMLNLEKTATLYLGYPAKITRMSLHVNRGQDQWWSNRYQDVSLSTSETANLHYDSNCGMLKAMVYINDVKKEDGPFRYVQYSKEWAISPLRRISGQALPYTGISLSNDNQRKLFLKLPAELRNLSHFGDDLVNGSEFQRFILENETTYTTDTADVILFDPYGLHRGGLSRQGERIAVQLQFSVWREWARDLAHSMFKKVFTH